MKKADILRALEPFDDNDNLAIDAPTEGSIPKFSKVCGKTERYTVHYCLLEPGHTGECWCACKQVHFEPDKERGETGWARQLDTDDEVTWNDPDAGKCSLTGVIETINWHGDVAQITFRGGQFIEAFEHELS